MQRNPVEQGPERHDDGGQYSEASERAEPGGTPAANGSDRKHNRQRFNSFHQRGKESGGDGWPEDS
jgi:hypothetical protein